MSIPFNIVFTNYALNKFEILNKHEVFFTKEQVKDCIVNPEETKKEGKYLFFSRRGLKVICQKELGVFKIITFYPVNE